MGGHIWRWPGLMISSSATFTVGTVPTVKAIKYM
jgi:hypothetical protein